MDASRAQLANLQDQTESYREEYTPIERADFLHGAQVFGVRNELSAIDAGDRHDCNKAAPQANLPQHCRCRILIKFCAAFTSFQNWPLCEPECKASYFAAMKICWGPRAVLRKAKDSPDRPAQSVRIHSKGTLFETGDEEHLLKMRLSHVVDCC